jgi:hypothetical protein
VKNTADVTGGKPIAVLLQSISGVSAINPLVAFYDIHGGKREVLFVYFVPGTTRVYINSVQLTSNLASLFPTLIPLSGVGITYFHHVMIKIQQLFLRLVAGLTSTLFEAAVGTNDCKHSRDQRLNVPSKARRSLR